MSGYIERELHEEIRGGDKEAVEVNASEEEHNQFGEAWMFVKHITKKIFVAPNSHITLAGHGMNAPQMLM